MTYISDNLGCNISNWYVSNKLSIADHMHTMFDSNSAHIRLVQNSVSQKYWLSDKLTIQFIINWSSTGSGCWNSIIRNSIIRQLLSVVL